MSALMQSSNTLPKFIVATSESSEVVNVTNSANLGQEVHGVMNPNDALQNPDDVFIVNQLLDDVLKSVEYLEEAEILSDVVNAPEEIFNAPEDRMDVSDAPDDISIVSDEYDDFSVVMDSPDDISILSDVSTTPNFIVHASEVHITNSNVTVMLNKTPIVAEIVEESVLDITSMFAADNNPAHQKRPRQVNTSSEESENIQKPKRAPVASSSSGVFMDLAFALHEDASSPLAGSVSSEKKTKFHASESFRRALKDSDVSMKRQRDPKIYEKCLEIAESMESMFDEDGIQNLRDNKNARDELYKEYVKEGKLLEGEGEDLPIYPILMASKTKETYLEAVMKDKLRTKDEMHKQIFEASKINDEGTSYVLKMSINGSLKADKLKICLQMIQNKEESWREVASGVIKRFPMDVEKVDTLEEVDDEGFLVCYEEMPDITVILAKNLNCMVIKPSEKTARLIYAQSYNVVMANVTAGAYGGDDGILPYLCFGPLIKEQNKCRLSTKLSAAFVFSMGKVQKTELKETVYYIPSYY